MIDILFNLSIAILGVPLLLIPFLKKTKIAWIMSQLSILLLITVFTLLLSEATLQGTTFYGGEAELDIFSLVFIFIGFIDALFAVHGMGDVVKEYPNKTGFYSVALLAILGILGIGVSNTITLLMTSWILFSVASFALVALPKDDYSVSSAVKYAIMGSASSTLLFLSFGIMLLLTGSLHFVEASPETKDIVASVALFLMAAVGFKMGVFPFHSWLPDTYGMADPAPIAFISSISKIAGILALYRASKIIAAPLGINWLMIVALFAIMTMTYGNITALLQKGIQRLLAYSSIAQAGYLLVGVAGFSFLPGINKEWVLYGLAFQLAAYTFAKTGTFLTVKVIRKRGEKPPTLDSLAGLYFKNPVFAASFVILILSLMGMPPLAGFWGKLYLFLSVVEVAPWLTAIALINTGIAAAYYARVVKAVYFEKGESTVSVKGSVVRATIICAIATIIVGILPFFISV